MDFHVLPSVILELSPVDLGICMVAWQAVRRARRLEATRLKAQAVFLV